MKPQEYDLRIVKVIKALRGTSFIKQINLANALNIDQSTYSRIEKGELSFSPGQLKIVAQALQTSHFQILTLADCDNIIDFNTTSYTQTLIKFILMITEKRQDLNFTMEELDFLISKIKEKQSEMDVSRVLLEG
ncbi:helix-turn-helix domain-containing protein [Aurantibacillus circumpalustris]|uniref:helix-turn-helix domain-containing protein n=1 Tax=Aurantibacillus circumpalustris TaxID=3036359 RepID=UPI00295AB878|nr:helix-turn-helix transcriptional regulator [Aurantibacillus circumpalustris]